MNKYLEKVAMSFRREWAHTSTPQKLSILLGATATGTGIANLANSTSNLSSNKKQTQLEAKSLSELGKINETLSKPQQPVIKITAPAIRQILEQRNV